MVTYTNLEWMGHLLTVYGGQSNRELIKAHNTLHKERTMRVETIDNPLIARVHSIFRDLREDLSTFFATTDKTLILFNFGDTPEFFQFRVRFKATHKTLKFIVARGQGNDASTTLEFVKLEKTRNIVRDIDEIYRVVQRDYIDADANLRDRLQKLFLWGIQPNKNRKGEIFKALGAPLPHPIEPTKMRKDTLYYGVVVGYTILESNPETDQCVVQFNLSNGHSFNRECTKAFLDSIHPNRVVLMNWLLRINLLSFTSAKHHVTFTLEQFNEIAGYLSQQQTEKESTDG